MEGNDFLKALAVPVGLLIVFVVAFWFVFGMAKSFVKAPTIDLISGNNIVTDQTDVPITGVVHNTSKLKVDGKDVPVSKDGSFSVVVPVNSGDNAVEIAAGDKSQTKSTVKITREVAQKAVTSTGTVATSTQANSNSGLATSGPVENVLGSFGLAMILLSAYVFRKSLRQNALQKA